MTQLHNVFKMCAFSFFRVNMSECLYTEIRFNKKSEKIKKIYFYHVFFSFFSLRKKEINLIIQSELKCNKNLNFNVI